MKVIINVTAIREASPIDIDNNIVNKKVYTRIFRAISDILQRIDLYKNEDNEDKIIKRRTHDIIGIFGRRGTGKTTVVLSVLNALRKDSAGAAGGNKSFELQSGDRFKDLVPLPVIDPTMMSSKEHMLLRVVNLVRDRVENEVKRRNLTLDPEWGLAFRRLVQGIVNLEVAGDGQQEVFYDEFAASEKMNAIVHVEELESNFTKFISRSLELLKKTAFVLAIDDMDTKPSAAWPSLECMRKYFTSPQLIVLLAGDLDMFTEIIRAEQRRFFNFQQSEVLGNFDFRPQTYIETLVEQYLLKLIPMSHRADVQSFLWSIREELDQYAIYDSIIIKKNDEEYNYIFLMSQFYQDWGIHLSITMDAYAKVLLDTPIRTTREVFNYLAESYGHSDIDDIRTRNERHSEMVQGLAHIFNNSLFQFGYDRPSQELQALETPRGIIELLDKLALHRLLQINNDDLHPRQHPMWLATSLVVIQGALSHAVRTSPGVSLHFLLKISVFKELAQRRGLLPSNRDEYRALRDNLHLADGISLSDSGKYLAGLVPCEITYSYAHGLGTLLLDVPEAYLQLPKWGSLYPLLGIYQRQLPAGTVPAFSIWSFIGLMGDVLLAPSDMLLEEVMRALPYPQTIPSQGIFREEEALHLEADRQKSANKPAFDDYNKRSVGVKTLLAVWRDDVYSWMNAESGNAMSAGLFPRIAQCFISYLQALDLRKYVKALNPVDFAVSYTKNCALLFLQAVLVEESRLITNTSPLRSLSLAAPIDMEDDFIYNCTVINRFFMLTEKNFAPAMPFLALCCTFPFWQLLLGQNFVTNMLCALHIEDHSIENILSKNTILDKRDIEAAKSVLNGKEMELFYDTNGKEHDPCLFRILGIPAATFSINTDADLQY